MAEFGEKGGPPPLANKEWKAPSGLGRTMETHREEATVLNGDCSSMSDGVRKIQRDASPGSPTPGSPGAGGAATTKPIPRRSSLIKDGSRAGRERKKTVSFSSSLSERKISSAADCIHSMVEGTELRKVRSNSRVYQRYYLLDAGLQTLCWEPSKKESDKARIALHSIREVRTGRNTDTFRTSGVYDQVSADCAFSIIYGETYDSLDLVANSAEIANIWVTGLRYLMQYGKHALDMIASSQDSLRLNWLEQLFCTSSETGGGDGVAAEEGEGEEGEGEEEGISLRSAVGFIRSVNRGVSTAKVEHRFRELQRTRERTCGSGGGGAALDGSMKDHNENKRAESGAGGKEERVTKQEFVEVFHDFCTRPEIYFLLVQFSSNKEFLDTKDLMRFLEAEQGVAQASEETSLEIVRAHEPSEEGRRRGWLSLDGFTRYLTSAECALFDPAQHAAVCHDMRQPLSHYFINSSHNTYLIEDQLRGPSDVSGYVRALKMGCRSVELDVWDGPPAVGGGEGDGGGAGEPVVCVGHTLSPPLLARCVLEAVAQFAFAASDYPLVLCLENHCSLAQQRVLLAHLVRTLGERLYTEVAAPPGDGEWNYLPSPHDLRGRVLLKGKKLGWGRGRGGEEEEERGGDVSEEDEGAETRQWMKKASCGGGGLLSGAGTAAGSTAGSSEKESGQKSAPAPPVAPRVNSPSSSSPGRFRLLPELSDLVALCRSVRFVDLPTSFRTQKPGELCSLDESLALRLAADAPGAFVDHNKRFLSRVYPGGAMRADSSNVNPLDLWKCGVQMVAMNFQTAGLMMDLNAAWFRQNGGCGFVLRPAVMRGEVSYFSAADAAKDTVLPGVSPQLLHVKVISGQNLPRPRGSGAKGDVVDPYVYVEIHGIPADCAERRTRTVLQNGDNPIFDESFEFQIKMPELAMVRFVVLDDDFIGDEFIGQYTIPLECLQPGYRSVPLQSLTGDDLPFARLFVHVALTNRRGGGKPHKRGLSVRKARARGGKREYAALRDLGVRPVDDVFKTAAAPLREATDLRENMQNSLEVFRELCGVSAVANLMQCVLALGSRVTAGPDDGAGGGAPLILFRLRDHAYPTMEPQGPLPEVLRKVVATYDTMVQASKAIMELSDEVYNRILHIQMTAMEFHEKLQSLAEKEGLKGRKVSRALERFSWNITILKGQADLLQHAKAEVQENMKQVDYAALTSNLVAQGSQQGQHATAGGSGSGGGRSQGQHATAGGSGSGSGRSQGQHATGGSGSSGGRSQGQHATGGSGSGGRSQSRSSLVPTAAPDKPDATGGGGRPSA